MRVTMMLCDYAQAADGKLNIIGGGWSITGPAPTPFGIAMLFQVPWDRANEVHRFVLELLDADGQPVLAVGPAGDEIPLKAEGSFETGRPPGISPGASLDFPVAFNSAPQQFPAGVRLEWRLTVDGEQDETWRLPFSTRAP